MSDELVVSGGGSVAVATEALFAFAAGLDRLGYELGDCAVALRTALLAEAEEAPAAWPAARARHRTEEAIAGIRHCAEECHRLARALHGAAERYGETESRAREWAGLLAGVAAHGLGTAAPFVSWAAMALVPGLIAVGGLALLGGLLGSLLAPVRFGEARERLGDWLTQNRAVLTDPLAVELIRLLVMSSDDAVLGLAGLDPVLAAAVGDRGLGLTGLDTATTLLMMTAGLGGLLAETGVSVRAVRSRGGSAPRDIADRVARIPGSDPGDAQIRIDRIVRDGRPDRFEVYLGGTIDFSPVTAGEPFDLTSDLAGVAGRESAAFRAAREAMHRAGIGPSSEVVLNGYSLGGLVAAELAGSGEFHVQGVLTLGAPAGQVPVPADIPWLAVQHADDLVPALGGRWDHDGAVLVERQVYAGRPVDVTAALPAHRLEGYRETAALIDRAGETRLGRVTAALNGFGRDALRVETTYYRADRVTG